MWAAFTATSILLFASGYGLIMPISKTDGSLDMSSLLSHIALLEQMIDTKSSKDEVTHLKCQLIAENTDLKSRLTTENTNLKSQLATAVVDLRTTQGELKIALTKLDTALHELDLVRSDLTSARVDIGVLQTQVTSGTHNKLSTDPLRPSTDLSSLHSDVTQLKTEVRQLFTALNNTSNTSTDLSNLQLDVTHLQTEVTQLFTARNDTSNTGNIQPGGATFTRWGRTICPGDSKTVYKGYTGGTWFDDKASSASILCLPEHPLYGNHTHGPEVSNIYGTEYETHGSPIFGNLVEEDMPCVVCESNTRRSAIMVPARNQCHPGWTLEYSGYLMGAKSDYASAEYICVDKDPEAITGGHDSKDGQVLYLVTSKCGSLSCPPYVDDWVLSCAVCSH